MNLPSFFGHGPPRPATQPPFSMKCQVQGEFMYSMSALPTPIIHHRFPARATIGYISRSGASI
ncbi:hypothetical protein LCGC14_2226990, partial [marine sediment metagenome]